MSQTPPVIGACLPVDEIPAYRGWLFDKDRDLEIQSFTKAEVLDGDWRPLAEEAVRLLDGHQGRLGIHGPFWGLPLNSSDPQIQAVVSRRLLQGLDVCEALGATHMVVHSPYTLWAANNEPAFPGRRRGTMADICDTLAPAVARAEDLGVTIVVENIEDVDPAARLRVVEEIDSPAVRVSLDTGHAQCMRTMSGAPPVDYYVTNAGAMLEHVHLQDTDGHADRHWAPGEGVIHWHGVFRALGRLPHKPRLLLELRDYAEIPAAMAHLEDRGLGQ